MNDSPAILCINPNAAIDKTVIVRSFALDAIHRPEHVQALPGGKGCNVARALKTLGAAPTVSGWVGGTAGQFIESGLRSEGIGTTFVHTDFESRTCLSILDPDGGTLTELYEKGEAVPAGKVAELLAHVETIVGDYRALTLSGSLPPGVPADFYTRLIAIAHAANVPVLLDSSGDPLVQGITAQPYLVKPNQAEFAALLGVSGATLHSRDDLATAARKLAAQYETRVVLSLGPDGALAAHNGRVLHVQNPRVDASSPVGSGDCMLAGLALSVTQDVAFPDALATGVAAGTANTLHVGAGTFTMDDFERIRSAITITEL